MLTSAFITLVKKRQPDYSRDNIRDILNEVQRYCLTGVNVAQLRMIDSTTGDDPLLTTSAGTYSYDIDTDAGFSQNAVRVTRVYTSATESGDGDYSSDKIADSSIDAKFFDATQNTAAKVIFQDDPGASTYYITAYYNPTAITSESVQISVPERYHLTYLMDGVIGYIEDATNGRSDKWERFVYKQAKEIADDMSRNRNEGRGWITKIRGY